MQREAAVVRTKIGDKAAASAVMLSNRAGTSLQAVRGELDLTFSREEIPFGRYVKAFSYVVSPSALPTTVAKPRNQKRVSGQHPHEAGIVCWDTDTMNASIHSSTHPLFKAK